MSRTSRRTISSQSTQSISRARSLQSLRQQCKPSRVQLVNSRLRRHNPNVRIEVVDAANTLVHNFLQTSVRRNRLAIADNRESLLPDTHLRSKGARSGLCLEALLVVPGCDLDGSRRPKQRDYKDFILHNIVSIGSAAEEVPCRVVGASTHRGVGRIALDVPGRGPVPVYQLLVLDVLVWRYLASFVGGDERAGHLQPATMRPEAVNIKILTVGARKLTYPLPTSKPHHQCEAMTEARCNATRHSRSK